MEHGAPNNECDPTEMAHQFREFANRLVQELELMTGKKLASPIADIDSEILHKFTRVLSIATDLEQAFSEPLTTKSARKILRLWNRSLRLTIPGIPRGAEPLEYVIHQVEQYSEPPAGFVPPGGLNYESKHLELCTKEFLMRLKALAQQ